MKLDKRDFPGATFPEWMYRYTSRRGRPTVGPRAYSEVDAGLHYLKGNSLPHFSVTMMTWEKPNANDCMDAGCQHETVLRLWPKLAPVVRLHLSDSEGKLMHMEANGWYQLAGFYGHAGNPKRQIWAPDGTFVAYREPTPDECLQSFANHVRIEVEEARILAHGWQRGIDYAEARPLYAAWLKTQNERFNHEADEAIAVLQSLIDAQAAKAKV